MICIYGIQINCKWYVGSTTNYENRKQFHEKSLILGKHQSKELQKAYNEYKHFEFVILKELKSETELESWENYFIGIKDSIENGYNMCLARRLKNIKIQPQIVQTTKPIKILTEDQLMRIIKISKAELNYLIECGMPYMKLSSRTNRYDYLEIIEWMKGEK